MGSRSVFQIASSFATSFVAHSELCTKRLHARRGHDLNLIMKALASIHINQIWLFSLMAITVSLLPEVSHAFKLKTESTPTEKRVSNLGWSWSTKFFDTSAQLAVKHFLNEGVHEAITHRIWGCTDEEDGDVCFKATSAPFDFIVGVRWNDNPPFQINTTNFGNECRNVTIKIPSLRSDCWLKIFKSGHKESRGKGTFFDGASQAALILRSHFGDMQFLHSMANKKGEQAKVTRNRILEWAEFSYKVAIGDIERSVPLHQIEIGEFKSLFDKQKGWTPAILFGMGDPKYQKAPGLNSVAFGSLLHMVQDGFARGHLLRRTASGSMCAMPGGTQLAAPGLIGEFRAYVNQDEEEHGSRDSVKALKEHLLTDSPHVVDIGKNLKSMFDEKRTWLEVKPYLECIYQLENDKAEATTDV